MGKQVTKAVIFDFDGTIADSFSVMLRVVHELLHREQSKDDISKLRGKSSLQALRELKIPLWRAYFLVAKVRRRMAWYVDEIDLVPGMDQIIRKLAQKYALYVVSANSAANVHASLQRFGVDDCFAAVYGGVVPWRKGRALRRLAREHQLKPHDTWYVGDEDLDIIAAHRAGMKAAAVTWGFSNIHVLKSQRPEALVFDSDELADSLADES